MNGGSAPVCEPPAMVFAHVFYLDVWSEMAARLAAAMPTPFRLVVTTPHVPEAIEQPATPLVIGMTVLEVENRGRDILPFLYALEKAEPFGIGLKLHTKRSVHREDGDGWRRAMLDSLLPSRTGAAEILAAFAADPRLGLVAPQGHLLRLKNRTNGYLPLVDELAERLGGRLTEPERDEGLFPAASMFWFRSAGIAGLRAAPVRDLFEAEAGQSDGTAAHAVERLFAIVAARHGYHAVPADLLHELRPESSAEDIGRLARRAARRESPHVWQFPPALLELERSMPGAARLYRRLPQPVKEGVRRLLRRASPGGFSRWLS